MKNDNGTSLEGGVTWRPALNVAGHDCLRANAEERSRIENRNPRRPDGHVPFAEALPGGRLSNAWREVANA